MWTHGYITGGRRAAALLCAVLASCGAAYGSTDANDAAADARVADSNAVEAVAEANEVVVAIKDSNSPFVADPNLAIGDGADTGEMLYKLVGAVVVVLVLGVVGLYLSRRVLPRISNLQARQVRVLETVHLGQHKTLHLVKAGDQHLLLGSTSERITRLATIGDELSEMDFLNHGGGEEE